MFTGIIDHYGIIHEIVGWAKRSVPTKPTTTSASSIELAIQHEFKNLEQGESIAVNGICLTVKKFTDTLFYCDLSPETLKLTTAQYLKIGDKVNLERALLPTTRLGGHFVTGHIDQTALVQTIHKHDNFIEMLITGFDKKTKNFTVKKGSIAINGVSLTINEILPDGVSLLLIPHTLERTNLGTLKENDRVNIEFDMLAKIVVNQLNKSPLTPLFQRGEGGDFMRNSDE